MINKLCIGLKRNFIVKNSFFLFSAEILARGSKFIFTLFLARYLGVHGFGLYSFVVSFVTIFQVFADFGLPILMVREVSKNPSTASSFFENSLVLKLFLSVVFYLLVFAFSLFITDDPYTRYLILIAALTVILITFSEFFRSFFRAKEKMVFEIVSKFVEALGYLIFIAVVYFSKGDLVFVFWGLVIIGVILALYNLFLLFYKFFGVLNFKLKSLRLKRIKYIFSEAKYLAISAFAMVLFNYIDQVIITFFHGNTDNGYYASAYTIILVAIIFAFTLRKATEPFISRTKDYTKIKKVFGYFLVAGVFFFVGSLIFGNLYLDLFFGSQYAESKIVIRILSFSAIPIFLNIFFSNLLAMKGRQKAFSFIMVFALVLNIILNIILIPQYSYFAAAFTTILTEVFSVFLCFYYVKNNLLKI